MMTKHLYCSIFKLTDSKYNGDKPKKMFLRAHSLDEAIEESKKVFEILMKDDGVIENYSYTQTTKLSSDVEANIAKIEKPFRILS